MRIRDAAIHPQFNTDVLKPLQIENIMDQEVRQTKFKYNQNNFHKIYVSIKKGG